MEDTKKHFLSRELIVSRKTFFGYIIKSRVYSLGQVFQFGSSTANFNFSSSNPGIFTFGANSTAPAQPTGSSGFAFSQASSFNLG